MCPTLVQGIQGWARSKIICLNGASMLGGEGCVLSVFLFEGTHKVDQNLNGFDWRGIVDGRPAATHRTVAFKAAKTVV